MATCREYKILLLGSTCLMSAHMRAKPWPSKQEGMHMCNSNDVSLTKSLRLWRVELCFAEQAEQQQLVRMLGSVDVTDQ